MSKINIMHILPSLEIGGMENGVVNLVNELDRTLFRPFICCLQREGPLKERLKKDVVVLNLEQKDGFQYYLPFKLCRLFQRENVAIVHTHNFATSLYGIVGARLANTPVIIHGEHGMIAQDKKRRKLLAKHLSNFVDCVTTVSDDLKEILISKIGINKHKIITIVNGVDIRKFEENFDRKVIREEVNLQTTDFVVGTVGRMVSVKGHSTLIEAFSRVAGCIPNSRLLLIGDGALRRELESQSKELGIEDRVKFLGQRADVHKLLHIMDIFVLPSLSEGMSNVILEAMASRLPVVATNVGNNSELVKNWKTGILINKPEPALIADAILNILSDIEIAKDMGKAGYEHARQYFSLLQMIKKYEDIYKYWLKNKGALEN